MASHTDGVRARPPPRARVGRDELIEAVARREGVAALLGLAGLTLLAWLSLSRLGHEMADMAAMHMAPAGPWSATDALLAGGMWAVMMVAMMLPGAAPMILVFATVNRKRRLGGEADGAPYVNLGLFVLGYLAVWSAFSVGAALAQWGLHTAALLSEDAMRAGRVVSWLSGGALLAWGVWALYSVL